MQKLKHLAIMDGGLTLDTWLLWRCDHKTLNILSLKLNLSTCANANGANLFLWKPLGHGGCSQKCIAKAEVLNSNHFLFADMYYLLVPCLQLFCEKLCNLAFIAAPLQLVAAGDNISNLVSEHFLCEETMILWGKVKEDRRVLKTICPLEQQSSINVLQVFKWSLLQYNLSLCLHACNISRYF